MQYLKISEETTYKSWIQLEAEAMKIIDALNEYTCSLVLKNGEPVADNVLYFDTSCK